MSDINDLHFDDKNFNKHTEFGMSLLEKSLNQFGAGRSVLVDKDNNIIAGNGIVEAAQNAGITKTRVIETDGTELVVVKRKDVELNSRQGREMAFADNATSSVDLDWDEDNLKTEFSEEEVKSWGVDVDWDEDKEIEEDEVPEVNEDEPADSKLGEVYRLGEHRLMCGDSTDAGSVGILMNGQNADMVFTDPPYNMQYSGAGFINEQNENIKKRIANIIDFDAHSIEYIKGIGIPNLFFFTSKDCIKDYLDIFSDWSFNLLTWHKSGLAPMLNNNFWPDTEYLLYFHKGKRVWNNNLKPLSIYNKYYVSSSQEGKKDGGGDLHPTMKPLQFISNEVKICSNKGSIVLDIFGGSGSTLIACEQLGRKCYMMELDPHYCDVIRKRYWKFKTGSEEGWQDGTKAE